MGIQWQDESVSLVYLPFQDEGRVEEVPRQKIIPAPLPFDCGESDSYLDCSFFFTQNCSVFGTLLIQHYRQRDFGHFFG